jgi:hypothetical protein
LEDWDSSNSNSSSLSNKEVGYSEAWELRHNNSNNLSSRVCSVDPSLEVSSSLNWDKPQHSSRALACGHQAVLLQEVRFDGQIVQTEAPG